MKLTWAETTRKDMSSTNLTEEMALNRALLKWRIHVAYPTDLDKAFLLLLLLL